ncbi:hypothetical protein DCAR_0933249 [Daucus carota subsp. sativus]|uniref:Uncharacterized protein n=1 Tax=Daucus carota subsp. sativus TaxID=79200 RepID=A0A175YCZ3_DAUCS|nr:hypothetical protein DCAR_0933249 [Daucus carota subsp. sativus]
MLDRGYKLSVAFWKYKLQSFDFVCAVDGAWGRNEGGDIGGGMGGFIKNNQGIILLLFSGPSSASNAEEAEILGVIYVLRKVIEKKYHMKRVVICSDSSVVLGASNKGLDNTYLPNFSFQPFIHVSIFVQYVPRTLNDTADLLAKKGICRPKMIDYWARP